MPAHIPHRSARSTRPRHLSLVPVPDSQVAQALTSLDLPVTGTVLNAATHLVDNGQEVTLDSLSDTLHDAALGRL